MLNLYRNNFACRFGRSALVAGEGVQPRHRIAAIGIVVECRKLRTAEWHGARMKLRVRSYALYLLVVVVKPLAHLLHIVVLGDVQAAERIRKGGLAPYGQGISEVVEGLALHCHQGATLQIVVVIGC